MPVRFTPTSSTHAARSCSGINIIVTERARFNPLLTGLSIADTLLKLFPADWKHEKYARLLANKASFDALVAGATAEALLDRWRPDADQFRNRRAPILLY